MTPWGWDDNGASHLDELHDVLTETCMIRHTKKDVLPDLPAKRRSVVPLPIVKAAEYAQARDDFVKWLETTDKKVITRNAVNIILNRKKTRLVVNHLVKLGYLKRLAAELKMKAVIEWINNFWEETDEKLVVFAYHKSIIKHLRTKFAKISVVLDGSTTQKEREANVKKFQKCKKTKLFIGQMVAAGTAITLTAASNVAFVELDWVPANHIQAEDRCHRIGQDNHEQIYYLVANDTIEQDLCKIIQKKAKVITSVLDGKVNKDMNVFDQLMKSFVDKL